MLMEIRIPRNPKRQIQESQERSPCLVYICFYLGNYWWALWLSNSEQRQKYHVKYLESLHPSPFWQARDEELRWVSLQKVWIAKWRFKVLRVRGKKLPEIEVIYQLKGHENLPEEQRPPWEAPQDLPIGPESILSAIVHRSFIAIDQDQISKQDGANQEKQRVACQPLQIMIV